MALWQINDYMEALAAQESSGNYNAQNKRTGAHGKFQIMPSNWAGWSQETFGKVVPKTPENQDAVARHKLTQYYNQFGSWEVVDVAWFAGPGAAKRYMNGDMSVLNRSDGNMTVAQYTAKRQKNMRAMNPNLGGPIPAVANPATIANPEMEPLIDEEPQQERSDEMLLRDVMQHLSDVIAGRETDSMLDQEPGSNLSADPEGMDALDDLDDLDAEEATIPLVPDAPTTPGYLTFLAQPTAGRISSKFGPRRSPTAGASSNHKGLDIAAPPGTPIQAVWQGTVAFAGPRGGYGNLVIIDHGNGRQTYYAHQSKINVKAGQRVQLGQTIGAVGSTGVSTGPHLHLEVRENGVAVDPMKFWPK